MSNYIPHQETTAFPKEEGLEVGLDFHSYGENVVPYSEFLRRKEEKARRDAERAASAEVVPLDDLEKVKIIGPLVIKGLREPELEQAG